MADGTDVGASPKWWERLLATPAALQVLDGGAPSAMPATQPVQETPPEATRQDLQPYLLRVVSNPQSQGILLITGVIVAALGVLAFMRRK